jgi:FkbM family methyltransferase
MRSLKRILRRVVRRFGYEVVPRAALEERVFAQHLGDLFGRLDIQCVLDVGANRGQYYRFLRDAVGYRGLVISFEPVAQNIAWLREQVRTEPSWVIHGYALGSEDRRMGINVMKTDRLSSFLSPDHSQVPIFDDHNVVQRREEVQVRRLDSVIGELRDEHRLHNVYLKLDTQGFDLEVIRGAQATLPAVRALQTELSVRPIYQNAPPYREMLDVLTARQFAITAMVPVVRDQLMRVVEFDCVMVNAGPAPPAPNSW